jgi:hypothetical protein
MRKCHQAAQSLRSGGPNDNRQRCQKQQTEVIPHARIPARGTPCRLTKEKQADIRLPALSATPAGFEPA